MTESYEEIRERHEREMREWTRQAMRGHTTINAAARSNNINPGTLWRLVRRWMGEKHAG